MAATFDFDPYTYGFGPGRRFFPDASPLAPVAPPASVQQQKEKEEEERRARAQQVFDVGDGGFSAPYESTPHPNPSARAALGSLVTGLGLAGPLGPASALLGLAISDARGVEPSFNGRQQLAALAHEALQSLFSQDRTATGLANAPEGTGARVGPSGLSFGDNGKGGFGPPSATKDDWGWGFDWGGWGSDGWDFGGPTPDPGKGEAQNGGSKGDWGWGQDWGGWGSDGWGFAGGGLVQLAGGGKVARGPGGGMDDLIPTTIEGRRLANLSDGEFVVPADVVSMWGDGSTAEGSRRLYELVRATRQFKQGNSEQARPMQFTEIMRRVFR
jgi:hypothetical protein